MQNHPSSSIPAPNTGVHDLANLIKEALATKPIKGYALKADRKPCKKGMRIYKFNSIKAGGELTLNGELEYAHAIYLERSKHIRNYRAQSPRIPYLSKNIAYPDFSVETIHGSYEIHEIKPDLNYLSERDQLKFTELAELLPLYDIAFKVFDVRDLFTKQQAEILTKHYQNGNLKKWTELEIWDSKKIIAAHINYPDSEIYKILECHNLSASLLDYHLFQGIRDVHKAGGDF